MVSIYKENKRKKIMLFHKSSDQAVILMSARQVSGRCIQVYEDVSNLSVWVSGVFLLVTAVSTISAVGVSTATSAGVSADAVSSVSASVWFVLGADLLAFLLFLVACTFLYAEKSNTYHIKGECNERKVNRV